MSHYSEENNELKKLHEERIKRQQQQKQQQQQQQQENEQSSHGETINHNNTNNLSGLETQQQHKFLSKQTATTTKSIPNTTRLSSPITIKHNLLLNSLISDGRSIREKENTIALSSLFQEDPKTFSPQISKNIKSIFMTTFGYEMEVLATIAESGVPFYLVNDTQENGEGKIIRNHEGFKNMSLIVPPRRHKGYGVFHTKMWLIRFSTFLRVVVCTGNQHAQDWIVWLNAYWYKDFYLKGMTLEELGGGDDDDKKGEKIEILEEEEKVEKVEKVKKVEKVVEKSKLLNTQEEKYVHTLDQVISILDSEDEEENNEKEKLEKAIQNPKPNPNPNPNPKSNPSSKNPNSSEPNTFTKFDFIEDFVETLKLVIEKICPAEFNFEKETGIKLNNYVFEGLENIVLIPSIPGRHSGKELQKYGMAKVKRIMKNYTTYKEATVTYNTTSLGIIEENFIRQLYCSFVPKAQISTNIAENYRVIYPSEKYISEETCGEAQVLFLKKENYYKSDLRKKVMYHYEKSFRNPVSGAIPHLKTIIIESKNEEDNGKCVFYMGSHNMTKAAWGTYEKQDSQISFSNSELGILFLDFDKAELQSWLPFKYPPRKYFDSEKPYLRVG